MRNIVFAVVAVLLGTSALVATLQGQSGLDAWMECLGGGELSVESVTACLEAGADPMARGPGGSTPLYGAAGREGGPAIVEVLLAAGADVMARTESGGTPLHSAVSLGDAGVVEALLAASADVMARDVRRLTPLHDVTSPATVEILLAAGADVMARDSYGQTPLHTVVRQPARAGIETVEALLAAGADVMARDANGMTALHHVADDCCRECGGPCAMGIPLGGDWGVEGARRNSDRDLAVLRALLAAGADPNARDGLGWTPLHFLAPTRFSSTFRRAAAEGVEALLAAGADPNARNRDGATPFDLAEQGSDIYWLLNDARYNAPPR